MHPHASADPMHPREKENMNLMVSGDRTFERTDARNAGVVADQFVSPGSGGAMLRRIVYIDPLEGVEYRYLTTETTLPPGLLVLLYKQRWDIEPEPQAEMDGLTSS